MGRPIRDLTGQKFGYLTVLRRDGSTNHGNALWLCKCVCGKETIVASSNLIRNFITSCGCKRSETISNKNKKHGKSRSRIYLLWSRIKVRCTKPNCSHYKNYGGRGITYDSSWEYFENFYKWALDNGYKDNLTIERIDVNGNYCPENCKWITLKEQAQNRRNTYRINYKGKEYCASELARMFNIKVDTLKKRINSGMSVEDAINKPVKKEHLIVYNNETHNITEWENLLGFKNGTIKERLKRGWSIKQIIETPLFGNKDEYK